ncbi:hypothetical protein AWH67_00020 [Bartonella bacilliformis]|nr:hypothetical protein AWH67_00020 [Bartonella bacilliformis]
MRQAKQFCQKYENIKFARSTNIKVRLFTIIRSEFYNHMRQRRKKVQDSASIWVQNFAIRLKQYRKFISQEFKKSLSRLLANQKGAVFS